MYRPRIVISFFVAGIVGSGCANTPVPIGTDEPVAGAGSGINVTLPVVPNLDMLDTPAKLPDGSYTVSGLLLDRETLRNQSVTVTALVQSIYRCEQATDPTPGAPNQVPEVAQAPGNPPAAAPTGAASRVGCKESHMLIADSLRSPKKLIVTGYNPAIFEAQMVTGQKYSFIGTYAQQTRGFISTDDGLIVVDTIVGPGIDPLFVPAEAAPAR